MLRSGAFSHDQAGVPAHGERRHLGADAWFLPGHGPPEHTRFRQLLTSEFMLRHMRRLEPLIVQTVTSALGAMRDSGPPADLVTSLSLPVPFAPR